MIPDYSHQPEAIDFLCGVTGRVLAVGPTGTGKTRIASGVYKRLGRCIILVPSVEIGVGFARALEIGLSRPTQEAHNIWTYKTALNRIGSGTLNPLDFDTIIRDEAHHGVDDTNLRLDEYFPHVARIIGLTATAYRGTPIETAKLLQYYGRVKQLISIKDAKARGIMALPECDIWPLHNDDLIDVTGGDFNIRQQESMIKDKMGDLVNRITQEFWDPTTSRWKRPIMLTFNSVSLCEEAKQAFSVPADVVTGETTDRQAAFARVVNCESILIQVKVVGEGVDLPIRILIDAAPTVSPVLFTQRFGRVTRPTDVPPIYICTNHNLLRHAYLLEGNLPSAVFIDYKKKWPGWEPKARSVGRVVGGLKGFEKFKPTPLERKDGTIALGMVIDDPTGKGHQYACIIKPETNEMAVARRDFKLNKEGMRDYSARPQWRKVDELPDLTGYSSVPASPLTKPMDDWWKRDAHKVNLNPKAEVNSRAFQFLPILLQARGMKI